MTELQELTNGKNITSLINELQFQINQGESLGGTICSYLLQNIINQPVTFTNKQGIKFKVALSKIEVNNGNGDDYITRCFAPLELVLYTSTEATWFPHHAHEFSDITN